MTTFYIGGKQVPASYLKHAKLLRDLAESPGSSAGVKLGYMPGSDQVLEFLDMAADREPGFMTYLLCESASIHPCNTTAKGVTPLSRSRWTKAKVERNDIMSALKPGDQKFGLLISHLTDQELTKLCNTTVYLQMNDMFLMVSFQLACRLRNLPKHALDGYQKETRKFVTTILRKEKWVGVCSDR